MRQKQLGSQILLVLAIAIAGGIGFSFLNTPVSPSQGPIGEADLDLSRWIDSLIVPLEEAKRIADERSAVFVDVRAEEQFKQGHIPGSRCLSVEQLRSLSSANSPLPAWLQRDRQYVLLCASLFCPKDRQAAELLHRLGFRRLSIFKDGYQAWVAAGYPVERGPDRPE